MNTDIQTIEELLNTLLDNTNDDRTVVQATTGAGYFNTEATEVVKAVSSNTEIESESDERTLSKASRCSQPSISAFRGYLGQRRL